MKFTPVKTPVILEHAFPQLMWRMPSDEKNLYLTFDDGPTPEVTPWVLDELNKYDAKATFFCVGSNVKKYPELFRRIQEEGHTVANHSFTHLKGWKNKTKVYLKDIEEASEFIDSKLFRPPYGQIKPKQIKALLKEDYRIVMWSVLSVDWDKEVSKEQCAKNVIEKASKGDVVVFHDSKKAEKNMKYALSATLQHFSADGYRFKRIPEPGQ